MDKENVNNSTMENTNQSNCSALSNPSPLEPSTNIQSDTNTVETVSIQKIIIPIFQSKKSLNSSQNQPSTSEKPIEKENKQYVPKKLSNEELEEKYGKRHVGKIVKWVPGRGYGFIQTAESQYDYFFHATDIIPRTRDHMNQGEKVTFSITSDQSESQAKDRAIGVQGDGTGEPVPMPPGVAFHGRWSSNSNRRRSSGNRKSWSQNNRNSFQGNNQRRNSNRSSEVKNKISSESWRAKKNAGGNRNESSIGDTSHHFRKSQSDSNFSNEQYAQNQLIYAAISPQQQALWQAFCASSPGVPAASFVSTPPPNAQVMNPHSAQDPAMLQMNWNNTMAMYPQQAIMNAYAAGYQGYNPMGSMESLEGINMSNSFADLSMRNSRSSVSGMHNILENMNTSQPMVPNSSNETGTMQPGHFNQQQQPAESYNMQQQYAMNSAVQGVSNMQQYTVDPSMYYNYAQPNMQLAGNENQMMDMNNMYLQNPSMDPRNSFTYSMNNLASQSMEGTNQLNANGTRNVEPGSIINKTTSAAES